MNKKGQVALLAIVALVLSLSTGIYVAVKDPDFREGRNRLPDLPRGDIRDNCALSYIDHCKQCRQDCADMGMRYMKGHVESGIRECWCGTNDWTRRIW